MKKINRKNPKKKINNINKQLINYAKYSSIAFQMVVIILLGVFAGIKLDKFLNLTFPIFTVIFTIISVIISIYYIIKDLIKFK